MNHTLDKLKRLAKRARVAIGEIGEHARQRVEIADATIDVGPVRVNAHPKQPECPQCGQRRG